MIPDIILYPLPVFVPDPDPAISKTICDLLKFDSTHTDIVEPTCDIARNNMIILSYQFDTFRSGQITAANIAANVIGGTPIAEFNVFQIIMNAIVNIIEVQSRACMCGRMAPDLSQIRKDRSLA